ncbi:MAG: DUF2325 domain-containing protein [Desulfuromonadaceae bacterium]
MSVVLVGGMDRLSQQYRAEAKRHGVDIQIFSQDEQGITAKIKNADGVVIFTNKVSHQARNRAFKAARNEGIPVLMHHSSGVCSLGECLNCIEIMGRKVCPSDIATCTLRSLQ